MKLELVLEYEDDQSESTQYEYVTSDNCARDVTSSIEIDAMVKEKGPAKRVRQAKEKEKKRYMYQLLV